MNKVLDSNILFLKFLSKSFLLFEEFQNKRKNFVICGFNLIDCFPHLSHIVELNYQCQSLYMQMSHIQSFQLNLDH